MRLVHAVGLVGLAFGLPACGLHPQIAEQRAAAYRADLQSTCQQYGFELGTQPFAQCMMSLDQQNQSNRMRMAQAILSRSQQPQPTPYMMPTNAPRNMYCIPVGNAVSCSY